MSAEQSAHEKMKHHLRNATKHAAAQALKSQEAVARHLEQNPAVAPAPTNTDTPAKGESSNV